MSGWWLLFLGPAIASSTRGAAEVYAGPWWLGPIAVFGAVALVVAVYLALMKL